jgi:hypothetical protein
MDDSSQPRPDEEEEEDVRDVVAGLPSLCPPPPLGQVADPIVNYWFDPQACGIYSSRYRLCFETASKNRFSADLDVCIQRLSYSKALWKHRMRNLHEAFRLAIGYQIETAKIEFFESMPVRVCPLSGELFSKETCHVDHGGKKNVKTALTLGERLPLTFMQLLKNFLREQERVHDMKASDIELTTAPPYELADSKLKLRWQQFHATHAVLQVVSRRANLYCCQ